MLFLYANVAVRSESSFGRVADTGSDSQQRAADVPVGNLGHLVYLKINPWGRVYPLRGNTPPYAVAVEVSKVDKVYKRKPPALWRGLVRLAAVGTRKASPLRPCCFQTAGHRSDFVPWLI